MLKKRIFFTILLTVISLTFNTSVILAQNNSNLSFDLAKRKEGYRSGMQNAGWCYDNYPDLLPLDAGATIELANVQGPGVITYLYIAQHILKSDGIKDMMIEGIFSETDFPDTELQRVTSRGLILEIYYNDQKIPGVRCPLADFFADGCSGKAEHFSTPFVEKLAETYVCHLPMPFEKSIRIILRNETPYNCANYSFVEYKKLPRWDEELLYFHCTWKQEKFQLTPDTIKPIIHISGKGHYIGSHYSIVTNEPVFKDFYFVMEGNCEYRIDGEKEPSLDYLGTECLFAFGWGFRETFCGLYSGINYLHTTELPFQLSIYRFRDQDSIIFDKSLDIQINWKHEFTYGRRNYQSILRRIVWQAINNNGGWIEYTTTHYWYQSSIGFEHSEMPSYEQRISSLLNSKD